LAFQAAVLEKDHHPESGPDLLPAKEDYLVFHPDLLVADAYGELGFQPALLVVVSLA
jgi:hypothetical protein